MKYLARFTQILLIAGVVQVLIGIWFGEQIVTMLPWIESIGPKIFISEVIIGLGCLITLVIQTLTRHKQK